MYCGLTEEVIHSWDHESDSANVRLRKWGGLGRIYFPFGKMGYTSIFSDTCSLLQKEACIGIFTAG